MNHKNTNKIKTGSMFLFIATVLVVGTTISMTIPSSFADSKDRKYEDRYGKDRYYPIYEDQYLSDHVKDNDNGKEEQSDTNGLGLIADISI